MSDNYSKRLEQMSRVRDIVTRHSDADIELRLAQMVVIGDQSSGKSSLLTQLTQIPFPESRGTTTKRPIVANTRLNTKLKEPKFWRRDSDGTRIEISKIEGELHECQPDITEDPYTIEVEGPKCRDMTLVDLPGIIHNAKRSSTDSEKIYRMINKYISPPETLIIVVTESNRDDETQDALRLAREADPEGVRTLRVLTKFDVFESDSAQEIMKTSIHDEFELEYGRHAVVCRPNGNPYTSSAEKDIFYQADMSAKAMRRCGVENLCERLPHLLSSLLERNWEAMQTQILDIRKSSEAHLQTIGFEPASPQSVFSETKAFLLGCCEMQNPAIQAAIASFNNDLRKTKNVLTKELVEENFVYDAFVPPFFQGNKTFQKIQSLLTTRHWKPLVMKLMEACRKFCENLLDSESDSLEVPICMTSKTAFQRQLHLEWTKFWSTEMFPELERIMLQELNKEQSFKTTNHYLTAKFQTNMILPKEVLANIANRMSDQICSQLEVKQTEDVVWKSFGQQAPQEDSTKSSISKFALQIMQDEIDEWTKKFDCSNLEEQQKIRILQALEANWWVAHKNLSDNVLATIRDYLVHKTEKWIQNDLLTIKSLQTCQLEPAMITRERNRHKSIVRAMHQCMEVFA